MKTVKLLTLLMSISILIASCSKNNSNDLDQTTTNENLKTGEWTVTHFSERGNDETHKFNGYTLIFGENGVFNISNSQITFTGSWYYDHLSDDSSSSSKKLVISIIGNDVTNELHDDWVIIEMNDHFFHLEDDSNDHTEILKISKI